MTRYARLHGEERAGLAALVRQAYESGKSIREISTALGYSYGATHALLTSSGATLRNRGGVRSRAACQNLDPDAPLAAEQADQ